MAMMLSRRRLLILYSLAYQLLLPSSAFTASSHPGCRLHCGKATARTTCMISAAAAETSSKDDEAYDLVVIGGGIGGMATAITVAKHQQPHAKKILLIESEPSVGGRVRSDFTDDGFILDRGFAVFIEAYPQSQQMLDYDALRLNKFLPGARVKLRNKEKLAAVSDPLRRRRDIIKAITSPVGSLRDKANLLPLFFTVITKDIQSLFDDEAETDTLSCLRSYNFSEEFISSFFAPFLEGIYLTPLSKQSSKMFYFVMKMFTVGSAALPMGGMQSVSDQLGQKAQDLGVEIKLNSRVLSIQQHLRQEEQHSTSMIAKDDAFSVIVGNREQDEQRHINAKSVVVATDYNVARNLLQDIPGLESLKSLPKLSQRSVGCIYYAFQSPAPLEEPILLLNGEGHERRNTKQFPVNNICFPSIVHKSYAPDGYELCCVSLLENAISEHDEDQASLDMAVRKQLSAWFPGFASDIIDESKWVTKGFYLISNAQPTQFNEDGCANVHGGRDCDAFQGLAMPDGMFLAGDHMATATFNGALESGVNAGDAVNSFLSKK
eukprot:scaffold5328_cov198-Skeletonema_marinoi.AAC.5